MRDRKGTALAVTALSVLVVGCGATQAAETSSEDATPVVAAAPEGSGEDWSSIWERGIPFSAFLENANRRRDTWHDNYERARVPGDVLAEAQSVAGNWRVLVVAEDWCGDSANTIPYLARLIDQLDNVDMRVVNSEVGRPIADVHRTPDGRRATPTVVVLDQSGQDVGCWVERPANLQSWFLEEAERSEDEDALYARKYAWYDWDVGESTVREVTKVLIAAAAGTPICN